MWCQEYSREATASVGQLFKLFSSVATWSDRNAGVERAQLDGPFAAGTTGTMVMPGDAALAFRLVWVDENRGFEDETEIPGADVTVRVRHELAPLSGGGTRITYRCVIDGPAADELGPEIGPAITGDFPDVLAALTAQAEAPEWA